MCWPLKYCFGWGRGNVGVCDGTGIGVNPGRLVLVVGCRARNFFFGPTRPVGQVV